MKKEHKKIAVIGVAIVAAYMGYKYMNGKKTATVVVGQAKTITELQDTGERIAVVSAWVAKYLNITETIRFRGVVKGLVDSGNYSLVEAKEEALRIYQESRASQLAAQEASKIQ